MARIPGPLFRQRLWPLPAAMAHLSFLHPHAGGGKRPHYLDLHPDYFGFHPTKSKLIPDYPDFSGFVNTEIGNAAVPATGNAAVPAAGKAGEDAGATITGNAAVPAAGKAGEDVTPPSRRQVKPARTPALRLRVTPPSRRQVKPARTPALR